MAEQRDKMQGVCVRVCVCVFPSSCAMESLMYTYTTNDNVFCSEKPQLYTGIFIYLFIFVCVFIS